MAIQPAFERWVGLGLSCPGPAFSPESQWLVVSTVILGSLWLASWAGPWAVCVATTPTSLPYWVLLG